MDMLKLSIIASHQLKMVLISTTMSSRQDLMQLKLRSTTSRKTLHSQEMLSSLGKKPLPLLNLITLDIALNHGEKLLRQKTSTRNLISLEKNLNNTLLFPTFLNLGKTISAEVLNST
jgi:hypothetical protein